jgi:hypothetical protein
MSGGATASANGPTAKQHPTPIQTACLKLMSGNVDFRIAEFASKDKMNAASVATMTNNPE